MNRTQGAAVDALYPLLSRQHAEEPKSQPLITPVARYVRITSLDTAVPHRVGWQDPPQKRQQGESQRRPPDGGHALTAEEDQHVDGEGHLDIYV